MFNSPFSLITYPELPLFSGRLRPAHRLLSQLAGDEPVTRSPAYDICKHDDNQYTITVSVPGFRQEELTINARDGQIVIDGQCEQIAQEVSTSWLHRGINRENFTLTLALKEGIQVQNASLEKGLLTINLLQKVPESEKFEKITIVNGEQSKPALEQQ